MAISKEAATLQLTFSNTSQDENGVTRHLHKIRLSLLDEHRLPWRFNLDNPTEESYCCSVVNRNVDLEQAPGESPEETGTTTTTTPATSTTTPVKLPFGLKFTLEQTDLVSGDNGQKRSTFVVYLRQRLGEENQKEGIPLEGLFGKALSRVECGCKKEDGVMEGGSFAPTKMFDLDDTTSVAVCTFKHSSSLRCSPKTVTIELELFDFSKATRKPFEVQEIMARRSCLRDTGNLLTTWLTPFDLTIHCNDGYKIRAHKHILAARSPVFARMFAGKDKKGKVDEDVQYAPMEVILHFIYSGSLHRYWKYQPEEVMEAASNYELADLIQFFDMLLPQICTNENALKLLKLAEEHDLRNAQNQIRVYIGKNFKDVFAKTVCFDWK